MAALPAAIGLAPPACDDADAIPDSYVLIEPSPDPGARASWPLLARVPPAASASFRPALRAEEALESGFTAEVLAIHHLTKRFVRAAAARGERIGPAAAAAAAAPSFVALGWPKDHPRDSGFMLHRRWGRSVAHPELRPVIVDPLADDADFARALVGRLGEAIVDLVAPRAPAREELAGGAAGGGRAERGRRAAAAAPGPLREGYTLFLRAVGAEWRASPARGRVSLIADAEVRAVRANYGVYGQAFECAGWVEPNRALGLQSAAAMVTEPVLIATVLHRMAASAAGRRVAAAEIYAPFLAEPAPTGVSGGAILGAFRNFQAKLLSAWAHATWRGEPPRDLVDLVDAYIQAFPEDRADVIRIFVVTTYGATVAAGGVPPGAARRDDDDDDDGAAGVARLNALVAAAQEGRLGLRAAIPGTGLAD